MTYFTLGIHKKDIFVAIDYLILPITPPPLSFILFHGFYLWSSLNDEQEKYDSELQICRHISSVILYAYCCRHHCSFFIIFHFIFTYFKERPLSINIQMLIAFNSLSLSSPSAKVSFPILQAASRSYVQFLRIHVLIKRNGRWPGTYRFTTSSG